MGRCWEAAWAVKIAPDVLCRIFQVEAETIYPTQTRMRKSYTDWTVQAPCAIRWLYSQQYEWEVGPMWSHSIYPTIPFMLTASSLHINMAPPATSRRTTKSEDNHSALQLWTPKKRQQATYPTSPLSSHRLSPFSPSPGINITLSPHINVQVGKSMLSSHPNSILTVYSRLCTAQTRIRDTC